MNIDNILDPINEDQLGGRKVILRLLDLTGGAKKKKKKSSKKKKRSSRKKSSKKKKRSSRKKSSKKKKRSSRKSRRKSKYDINLDDFDRYDYRYRYSNINTFSKSRAPKMGSNDAKMGSNDAKTGSRIPRIRPPRRGYTCGEYHDRFGECRMKLTVSPNDKCNNAGHCKSYCCRSESDPDGGDYNPPPPPPPPAAAPMPPLFRIPPIGRAGIHDGIAGPASPISPIGKPVPAGAKMTFGEGFTEEIESYMNQ